MAPSSYHYKSPEEVRREIQKRSAAKKSRRRMLLIIFVDLVISGMVLAALFYGGFLGTKKLKSKSFIETKKLRISASLEWEEGKGVLYLYVENKSQGRLSYPSPQSREGSRIIFLLKSKKSSKPKQGSSKNQAPHPKELSFPFKLKERSLRAGETMIYRQEIVLPADTESKAIRVELSEGSLYFFL